MGLKPLLTLGPIARILEAVHLQTGEYVSGADGTTKDGQALEKDAHDMLDRTLPAPGKLVGASKPLEPVFPTRQEDNLWAVPLLIPVDSTSYSLGCCRS